MRDVLGSRVAGRPAPAVADRDLIGDLGALYRDAMSRRIPPGAPTALIDMPLYPNIGDSAIAIGEMRTIDALGHQLAYISGTLNFDVKRARAALASEDGVLLIHGGGNLGDMWLAHQHLREHVAVALGDRRVVQLPQSIHFSTDSGISHAKATLNQHRDFVLMVRDLKSLDFARREFTAAQTELVPDGAFALGPLRRSASPSVETVWLLRTDAEARESLQAPNGAVVWDWRSPEATALRPRSYNLFNAAARRPWDRPPASLLVRAGVRNAAYRRMLELEVQRGVAILSSGRTVVTDRLHGHILCVLLGIPHVLVDSGHGKITAFHERWTQASAITRFATDFSEVPALLADLPVG